MVEPTRYDVYPRQNLCRHSFGGRRDGPIRFHLPEVDRARVPKRRYSNLFVSRWLLPHFDRGILECISSCFFTPVKASVYEMGNAAGGEIESNTGVITFANREYADRVRLLNPGRKFD